MRSPQAGQESLNSRNEASAAPPVTEQASQRRTSGLERGRPDSSPGATVSRQPVTEPEAEYNRFTASSLTPVGETPERRSKRLSIEVPRQESFRQKPLRFMDRALLAVEVMGALVVAWLVFQYIYTAYIDTGPRRVSPPRSGVIGGQVAGGVSKSTITAVPTRFVEVAPPLSGGPDDAIGITAPTPTPTPTISLELRLPTHLRIPAMSLDSPVHEVTINMGTWEVSPMDIGHHAGTGIPGEQGNVVLAGHRDINSALFRELDRLGPGDEIFVSNSLGEYRYIVSESVVVGPEHIEVMDPTDDSRVTLITCTPIGLATQRLVVTAVLDTQVATR
jgi:LPXTG-site transpeptidase (sortase) family protein